MTADDTSPPKRPSLPAAPPPGVSEHRHSLPSALRSEADFLNRRFAAFADDLMLAATELEDLRAEVAYLRAGILRAIEGGDDRLVVLRELYASPAHPSRDELIG